MEYLFYFLVIGAIANLFSDTSKKVEKYNPENSPREVHRKTFWVNTFVVVLVYLIICAIVVVYQG